MLQVCAAGRKRRVAKPMGWMAATLGGPGWWKAERESRRVRIVFPTSMPSTESGPGSPGGRGARTVSRARGRPGNADIQAGPSYKEGIKRS